MSEETKYEYKIINKFLMLTREVRRFGGVTSWCVEPNIFETAKAQAIFDAKDSSAQYLPRFTMKDDRFPEMNKWVEAFSSDNSPAKVCFRGFDIAKDLENIDFSKPYNDEIAQQIRSRYSNRTIHKKTEIDADLIIQGELGELE